MSCGFPPEGGGGAPYDGLYREAPPPRGTFSRLPSLVEVYKRVGKSVGSVKGHKRANR